MAVLSLTHHPRVADIWESRNVRDGAHKGPVIVVSVSLQKVVVAYVEKKRKTESGRRHTLGLDEFLRKYQLRHRRKGRHM